LEVEDIGIFNDLISTVAVFLISAVLFFFVGVVYRKKSAESKIGTAEKEAKKIVEDAKKDAETQKIAIITRMSKPSVIAMTCKKIRECLPASMQGTEEDLVTKKQKEVVSATELVPEKHDKYSVVTRNVITAFDGYTLEEAVHIKTKLDASLGKLRGKTSFLERGLLFIIWMTLTVYLVIHSLQPLQESI
jgi:hypothetical protein